MKTQIAFTTIPTKEFIDTVQIVEEFTLTTLKNGAIYTHLRERDLAADLKKAQRKHSIRLTGYRILDPIDDVIDRTIAHLETQLAKPGPTQVTLFGVSSYSKPQSHAFTAKIREWLRDKVNAGSNLKVHFVDPIDWGFK